MPRAKKKGRHFSNADFRHRANFPAPSVEEIEESLMKRLTPGVFAPMRMPDQKKKLRERILTLPVMVAIVVSLVWRNLPSLSEVLRLLASEGLLWVSALEVSKQALSKRLDKMPASLFAQVFIEAIRVIRNNRNSKEMPKELKHFSAIWISDGSTMEALKKKIDKLKGEKTPLGGKIMMV